MTRSRIVQLVVAIGIAGSPGTAQGQASQKPSTSAAQYPGRYPITTADVQFVTGMISHHAQALVMAAWAPTHGASKTMQTLCARITNAQKDEITIMQRWLKDRGQPVPEPKPVPMKMIMNGVEHEMMMPGMLTDEQLKQLDEARDGRFDQLFLTFMIQHHKGALTMVDDLFAAPGAGQDDQVFKLASDIYADQSAEIERMQRMLFTLPQR
jgi:uncharacterized protein (DUF305 family)